jgi:HEAT repeat protein
VLSECLLGLLTVDPKENLPIVTEFLEPSDAATCEAAAMALGKSRLAEALDPLTECLQRCFFAELRQHILLAIAILRRPAAIDFLLGYVSTEPEPDAVKALSALGIYKDDPRLFERVESVVDELGSRTLQAAFAREFRSEAT